MKRSVLWLLCLLMLVPAGLAEDVISMDDIVVEDSLLPDLTDSVQIEDLSLLQESKLSSNAPGDGQTPPDQPGGGEGQTLRGDGGQPGGSTDEQSGSDSAATTLTKDSTGKTYKSTTGGENAVLVNSSNLRRQALLRFQVEADRRQLCHLLQRKHGQCGSKRAYVVCQWCGEEIVNLAFPRSLDVHAAQPDGALSQKHQR